jgi:uncharacterized protein (TIGR02421 family)
VDGIRTARGPHAPERLTEPAVTIDRRLSELSALADPLLAVTPMDPAAARARFVSSGCDLEPELHYRPLGIDPDEVKRALHELPVDDVEDPALATLFAEKRHELDAQLDLLLRRDTSSFLPMSMVLYGSVQPDLLALAQRVLAMVQIEGDGTDPGPRVDASAFAAHVLAEIDRLREQLPGLSVPIEIRDDVTNLMVDHGRLLIPTRLSIEEHRVDALVQHELGTHVLTWVNGGCQPLGLLQVGLPHYDETQEALAVVAELLVGGLTPARMATLATRVLAAHLVIGGASFVETYRAVRSEARLTEGSAFDITMRVHAGGGFTKDVVYLRGVDRLLGHLADGGDLETLLLGKFSIDQLPVVEELRDRDVLVPPTVRPSWLSWPGSEARQRALSDGIGVEDLVMGVTA